jgi:hypothetical protein
MMDESMAQEEQKRDHIEATSNDPFNTPQQKAHHFNTKKKGNSQIIAKT